ncbi:MAG: D-alanyl-D-alanine carboxypeptidase [Lachnospiraceae bacterium]|nr:D-alanyl-D-alanine carboxypeptidase [Lachnospiraceae bacterium]
MRMKLKKAGLIFILMFSILTSNFAGVLTYAEEEKLNLYALSAVLMDAESGRVLYSKEGDVKRAMASTTKIMTCIIALEYGNLSDVLTVSKYASSMPDVQLNIKEGEMYNLEDMLYSLMLESHNDTAVAIAEHIAGSVEAFAELMNNKARELGCFDTYFITPNGLDASKDYDGETKVHSTTAKDLATIMSYCIKNEKFVEITRKSSHMFTNKIKNDDGTFVNGNITHIVSNRNAFFNMMDGVISGKTGFTNDAGYCYVCALESNGRKYAVALLGCGWPNNKTYKWSDSKTLFNYGMEFFKKEDMFQYGMELPEISVNNGVYGNYRDFGEYGINADKPVSIKTYVDESPFELLCKENEQVEKKVTLAKSLEAPVYNGQVVGYVTYRLSDGIEKVYEIKAKDTVEKKDFTWSFGCVFMKFITH